jgi:hypothetical protein
MMNIAYKVTIWCVARKQCPDGVFHSAFPGRQASQRLTLTHDLNRFSGR